MSDERVSPPQPVDPWTVTFSPHRPNEPVAYAPGTWEPGDPLYVEGRGNHARRLFDVLPAVFLDVEWVDFWCHRCDVAWVGDDEGAPGRCWSCGRFVANPRSSKAEVERRRAAYLLTYDPEDELPF